MRIALVGAGRVAGSHAAALKAFPDHTISAFADLNLDQARLMADEHGGQAFSDYHDLLAAGVSDAVVICVPHCLHREVAVAAFAAGQHVLLEKPMACSVDECDEIIAAQQKSGCKLMIGYTHHFMPIIRKARELIQSGRLGKLVLGTDLMSYGQVEPEAERKIKWLLRKDAAGGGTVMNNGSHAIGRLMFMTGQHVTSVYAACGNERPDLKHIDVELHTFGLLHFSGGAVISLWQDAYGQRDLNRNEFTGTEGAMTFPTYGGGIELYRDREKEDVPVDGPPAWQAEWAEFIGAIEEGRDPSINGYWGRRVVEIAQAMYRSSELKKPVDLPRPLGL